MRNISIILAVLVVCFSKAYADTVTVPTTYAQNGQVTSTNLNGNFNALAAVLNGGLDNNNANTTGGYRFFEIRSSLPSAGSQGRTIFNTSDNTLNTDNGSAWLTTVTPSGTVGTGKIPYYNGGWTLLTPGSQYLALVSNGASSLPSYQALDPRGGGTGITSYAQGDILYANSSTSLAKLTAGTAGQILQTQGASANPQWINASRTQIFTSSGSFTAPTGVTKVYLTMCGAGGGGKTSAGGGNGGGGGSAGGAIVNYPFTVTPGNSYTVTINAGGSAGASGGTTVFDSITMPGGLSGVAGSTGGASVTCSNGAQPCSFSSAGSAGLGDGSGGAGGNSLVGAGGTATATGTGGAAGNNAAANTCGGGGGGQANGGTGGTGGSGIVIVQY